MASPPSVHAGGAAATRNTQYIQQFLSNVLSQRGPSALPYAEDVKWLIRQHLLALVENYPSLQPKTATFTHNDGRTVNILQAEGTIPIVYAGVVYNIPVVIWLMESYPRHSSCVYVTPTRDMIIKRPHSHVNPSGLVSHPYLQNWIYPSSNLVDLVGNLCHVFSREPPLYSRPHRPNPNPRQSENSNSNSSSSSSSSIGRAGIPPKGYSSSSSPYGNQFPPSPQRHRPPTQTTTEDPSEVYRRNAINKLMEKLHVDSEALGKGREAEMEGLFNLQTALRQREEHLSKELRKFQGETEELEQQLQMVLMNTDLLESWLRENEGRVSEAKILEVEEILEPCDALSKQMLECTASDLAIEDVVYSLDKAVQEGSIPFDQYLRSIRSLSREQFFHRAMTSKIKSTQLQAQVSSMAARASQYM